MEADNDTCPLYSKSGIRCSNAATLKTPNFSLNPDQIKSEYLPAKKKLTLVSGCVPESDSVVQERRDHGPSEVREVFLSPSQPPER